MTSIHHDIVFRRNERTRTINNDGEAINERETTQASTTVHQSALATGQFAFVEGEKNKDEGHLPEHQRTSSQPSRRLLGSNLYSSFRKKSNKVDFPSAVEAKGIVFIPSQISLREGSFISDLQDGSSRHTHQSGANSKRRDRSGDGKRGMKNNRRSMDPRNEKLPDRRHEPAVRPKRRTSFGSVAPQPPKLRELIQDSGILDEIAMQKDGSMQSILDKRLSRSEWRQLSKKTQLAVSTAIESTLQEVLSLEDHPSLYSSAKSSSTSQKAKNSMHSTSNGSSSTNEWLSFGDTTLSSRSLMGETHSSQDEYHVAQLQTQRASSEPDSESARPLPHLSAHVNEQQDHHRIDRIQTSRQPSSNKDATPTNRSLSVASRYEPSVSPIPDGVELDVLPLELDNYRRRAGGQELQLPYVNRKDSTQSVVSEITMDTKTPPASGRSILTTPPATPMILDPRAPQLLMAKLQSDPNAEENYAFPRPPMDLASPTPPMRKRSPDDDQVVVEDAAASTSAMPLQPYARKGTLTESAREQVLEMGAILENDELVEDSKAIQPDPADDAGTDSVDLEVEELSISESEDPLPISLRGPFATESDAAPRQLGGLLRPLHDSNPLQFPAPLISDDEDEEHFEDDTSELEHEEIVPSHHQMRPNNRAHRELLNAITATPSINNRRKGLFGKYHRDKYYRGAKPTPDGNSKKPRSIFRQLHSELQGKMQRSEGNNRIEPPTSAVGQFRQLNATKSTFRYPKPPSEAMVHDDKGIEQMPRMKVESHPRSHTVAEVDETVESADPPPVSLRGPFADEDESTQLQLGSLLKPNNDSNPLLFPAPLLSSDDDDGLYLEDESDAGGAPPPAPETTFIPPSPLDAPLKTTTSSRRQKPYQSNVFNPSAVGAPAVAAEMNHSKEALDSLFDFTKRSSLQNSSDDSNFDIHFDASTSSIEFDPEASGGNEKLHGGDTGGDILFIQPPHSKINSSVVADGQVDGQFCFSGLIDGDDDGVVRVKLCPAQIAYLLDDGKAHVHPGYYSGPLNSQCRMHGNGMFWFASGDTYLGQFRNGELHGAGMMSVTDEETGTKQVFSGYFSHNKYVGDEVVDDESI